MTGFFLFSTIQTVCERILRVIRCVKCHKFFALTFWMWKRSVNLTNHSLNLSPSLHQRSHCIFRSKFFTFFLNGVCKSIPWDSKCLVNLVSNTPYPLQVNHKYFCDLRSNISFITMSRGKGITCNHSWKLMTISTFKPIIFFLLCSTITKTCMFFKVFHVLWLLCKHRQGLGNHQ